MPSHWSQIQRDLNRVDRLNMFTLVCLGVALAILAGVIVAVNYHL